ncbi:restriction system protein [Neobacillus ginsengisoli]|uniref:Restriction system protein n=2 Tax=Neobacillus ginsengisoli TaxID=904295 RepID=A0ABT9Y0N8_9BACI|nr:restriction system protein [Neobacillus ginsengisoli]
MVRAGDNNELISLWLEKGVASIGWADLDNPKKFRNRNDFIEKAHEIYYGEKPGTRINWASQVWRFAYEIEIGDRILSYARDKREYIVGKVTGTHKYDSTAVSDYYPNCISVKWEEKKVSRDLLSQAAKNSLGSTLTVFRVDDWGTEFDNLLKNNDKNPIIPPPSDDDDEDFIIEDFVSKALTLIQDKVDKLDAWQMQELVAGLLQAMGYNVKVSKKGPDGGVDILAHKDALGFERPIIKVQVKHRKSSSSGPEIQQLLGAHPLDASCLFVSTGGFTSHAEAIAKHHNVKLLDLEELVNMIVFWYEKMPNDTRSLLPLQKIYVPE